MRLIIAFLVLLLCVSGVEAADKKVKTKAAKKTQKSGIIKPYQSFEWGDTVFAAIGKICALQPLPAARSYGTRKIACRDEIDLNVTDDVPLYIFGADQNVSLLNYKGSGIQVGTGYEVKYAPVLLHQLAYEATLQFNAISEGYSAYLFDNQKARLPWMLQKGSRIYLPVVLTSLRLSPLDKDEARLLHKDVIADLMAEYRSAFIKEVGNDKHVFHRNGTWLYVYDDGDIFYDAESYLKGLFSPYEHYYDANRKHDGMQ